MISDIAIKEALERNDAIKKFLCKVLEVVPEGSIWGIQGLYENDTLKVMDSFFTKGLDLVCDGIYPHYYVVITSCVLCRLKEIVMSSNLVNDICEHQFIVHDNSLLFVSYDNFEHTSLNSKKIPQDFCPEYKELFQFI